MSDRFPRLHAAVLFLASTSVVLAAHPCAAQDAVSVETLRTCTWMGEVSNHGRWGADDELGTLNLISPEIRLAAVASVTDGVTVSLAHDLVPGSNPNAIAPFGYEYGVYPGEPATAALETLSLLYHGWAYSHVDALSHFAFDGVLYNGFDVASLTESGSTRLGIDVMREGIVTRGFLIDVPALRGVEYLEPGEWITAADFEAWEARIGARVSEGDVLLVRTGRWARESALGPWSVRESAAGIHPSAAHWLRARGVVALGGDAASERAPSAVPGVADPLHQLTIVALGMPLFDNLDFEALAAAAAERGTWTFLFMAGPLRVRGGSGSPVNPIAIF